MALADCATVNSSWVTTTKKIAFQSAERFGEPKYVDLYSWYENIESQALALKEFCLDPEPTRGFLPEKRVVLSKQRGARSRLSRTDRIKLSLVKKQNLLQKRDALIARIREGKALIESLVIANAAGSEHAAAHGISIYYPTKTQGVHSSYKKTLFWQDSRWSTFIPFS